MPWISDAELVILTVSARPTALLRMCDAPTRSFAGSRLTFTVQAADQFGNAVEAGGDKVEAYARCGFTTLHADVEDLHNGSYQVHLSPSISGDHEVFVLAKGQVLPCCPFSLQVREASLNLGSSYLIERAYPNLICDAKRPLSVTNQASVVPEPAFTTNSFLKTDKTGGFGTPGSHCKALM